MCRERLYRQASEIASADPSERFGTTPIYRCLLCNDDGDCFAHLIRSRTTSPTRNMERWKFLMTPLTSLPAADDTFAVFEFAMSFNGYEHFGSFEASATAAASGDRSSLALIRNELFFVARASRHGDDDRFVDVYRLLLPLFVQHSIVITRI
jgi:hypothetical protein